MDSPDCFALIWGAGSQVGCTCCAISGGSSNSAEPLAPEGKGVWRCLAVEKLSQVELRTGTWDTEPRSQKQTCIDEVDFDADVQPGDDPQKGQ
jgi:hypothetical protein